MNSRFSRFVSIAGLALGIAGSLHAQIIAAFVPNTAGGAVLGAIAESPTLVVAQHSEVLDIAQLGTGSSTCFSIPADTSAAIFSLNPDLLIQSAGIGAASFRLNVPAGFPPAGLTGSFKVVGGQSYNLVVMATALDQYGLSGLRQAAWRVTTTAGESLGGGYGDGSLTINNPQGDIVVSLIVGFANAPQSGGDILVSLFH